MPETNPNAHQTAPETPVTPLTSLAPLPPTPGLEPAGEATPEMRARAAEIAAKADLTNPQAILMFGVDAQKGLSAASEAMIEKVRNSESGEMGKTLTNLMVQFKGIDISALGHKPSLTERVFSFVADPIVRFQQRFETVSNQIAKTVNELEGDRMTLSRDVVSLDKLFAASVAQFRELTVYILAGEEILKHWDEKVIPEMQAKATASNAMLDAQAVRDAQNARTMLDRRLHNLRVTRIATLQSLPQIRLIQDVDRSLVDKIQTSILTTIPIWRQQIAMGITLARQQVALRHGKAVDDATNEMLRQNAEMLSVQNKDARQQIERGVIDLSTLAEVNDKLLHSIQDAIQISTEAKARRLEAAREMITLENNLKEGLKAAATTTP